MSLPFTPANSHPTAATAAAAAAAVTVQPHCRIAQRTDRGGEVKQAGHASNTEETRVFLRRNCTMNTDTHKMRCRQTEQ